VEREREREREDEYRICERQHRRLKIFRTVIDTCRFYDSIIKPEIERQQMKLKLSELSRKGKRVLWAIMRQGHEPRRSVIMKVAI
jgi:hypothetical protein